MTQYIKRIFNPLEVYFFQDGVFGENIYVIVVEDAKSIGKKVVDFYNLVGDEIPLVILTKEEWENFDKALKQKGEKIL
ncbi:hypothetical protein [Pseudothermotoga thermarum]|uniref:Uncharacterized protein n=1 Tax=Pseudothermotoga thermarum DSM 5069 TaxID=688269 RepID=F7YVD0_9THEM|nr:hypothetical protein [Pseudothermotoga thermarum]AEH50433.1 hypothetical protein Theth_0338 [Pseudothermotoga thermarum DSM 5069]